MTIHRPVFGRKQSAGGIPPHPGPDRDGVSRIIPLSVWEGKSGDFLRALGRSPDDADNMMPTPQVVQARHDAYFAEQTRFVERVNSQIPAEACVGPYAMLPWSLWHGEFGAFLMVACQLYPTQPWNTMLLPDTDRGAFILDLPKHPGAYPPNLQPSAERHLREFRDELDEAKAAMGAKLEHGYEVGQFDAFGKALDRAKSQVIALANTFAAITFGDEVYERHLDVWGKTLGWPHAMNR